jgi:hypothetical protein
MNRFAVLASLASLTFLAACVTVDFTPSPAWTGDVQVLDRMPDHGYQRVGMVVAKSHIAPTDTTELTRALQERAAEQGANAIVIVEDFEFHYAFFSMEPLVDMKAVAIRIDNPISSPKRLSPAPLVIMPMR